MRYKKVIITLLVLLLIVTLYGCTTENKTAGANKNTEATYREIVLNDVLDAENISNINLNENNELVALIGGDSTKYVVLDENTEIKKEISIDFDGRASVFSIDSNNNMYILSEKLETNENKDVVKINKKLFYYDNESDLITENNVIGDLTDTTARSIEEITRKIKVDSKGNIYALKLNGQVEVLDSKLNSKKILDSIPYWDIEIDEEDNLLALQRESGKYALNKIDTSNYKIILSKEYSYTDAPESIYYNKNTKSLYGVNLSWVVKYNSKGNITNRLLNAGELSYIRAIMDFVVDDNEEVYIAADAQESFKLIKYTTSNTEVKADADTKGTDTAEKKIEIFVEGSQDYDNLFPRAARKFQEKNPGVKVTVNSYPDLDTYQYRDKLNTELMAGKGPDILNLRSWDYIRTYMRKGILVNLDEMIENDSEFNIADYNTHIIDIARYKDELYVMPIGYSWFHSFILNEKLLEEKGITLDDNITWKDIYALSKKLNENSTEQVYVLPKIDDSMLMEFIILSDADYYMDFDKKETKFNSKEFIETLKLLKAIKEDNVMHPDADWMNITNNQEHLENTAMLLGQFNSYFYIWYRGAILNSFSVIPLPKGEHTGDTLCYSNLLAINSNSEHKELAWEFMKLMLTEEIQAIDHSELQKKFHINNNANKKQIDWMFEYQETSKQDMERKGYYYSKKEDIEKLSSMLGNLTKLKMEEPFEAIIIEEIQAFLNDEKSAEEVAKQLQNKAEIYLNE